ncbi:zinc finger protein 62 homolog isoform X4 [Aricia agestis]|uniref:zinc finger protein 62 homolog isoform X4 n=1 Tax=Aricia agestis TaxID=91739 RepID=UPI001C207334|nr:zinc finger protein 62 homolog isoform X4 [Aricia agestis]
MEFQETVVKDSPGLCRCCLSEGCYKELGAEYTWFNETEIYADMLLDCFDISISQHVDGPNGPNRLICEVCITRLRDACEFKKQVLESEKKFINMVCKGEFSKTVLVYKDPVKVELKDNLDTEYLDEDLDLDNDDLPEKIEIETPLDNADLTASVSAVKKKRGRPKKTLTEEEKPTPKKAKLEDKPRTSKGDTRERQRVTRGIPDFDVDSPTIIDCPPKPALTPKEKRKIMRSNVLQVLVRSTVMPFRWLKSSYRCFYCYDIFQDCNDLKNHQHVHAGDEIKEQAMNNYWEPVVYVDVSNLSCKLCPESVNDLYDLVDHLIAKHGIAYNKDIGVCMVAFKLDNFSINCLACGANFFSFGPLLYHTNKDHKGASAILCDVCGQNFKDAYLLRLHVKAVHENSGLLCPECGEKFESRSKLKTHQKNQHDLDKKFKCSLCAETFQSHYKRSRHMVTEHKNRQEIKCLYCPKTFVFRSMMMTHLRDTHLKVRNHVCSVCGWKAFNSNRLKNHMYKHSGEKNFKCDGCDKAFTTKKIMRAHFARMHKTPQPPMMQYDNPYVHQ